MRKENYLRKTKMKILTGALLVFIMTANESQVSASDPPNWVGAKSHENFQPTAARPQGWTDPLPGADAICGGFVNRMNQYSDSQRRFWTDLTGARWRYIDGSGDHTGYGVDTVDIHMTCTHGGAWSNPLAFSVVMHENQIRAFSNDMRLGDNGRQLSIYTAYTCSTMLNDGDEWNRWRPVFRGGLKHAAAFWGEPTIHDGVTDNFGRNYAINLHTSGHTLRSAWLDAMDDYTGNPPGVMATGSSSVNCSNRRDTMTWGNYKNDTLHPRLTDGAVVRMCSVRRQG